MKIQKIISFLCYFCVIVLCLVFALIYMFRPEFMPYHAAAVGKMWTELSPNFQALVLALMRVSGGGWLATSISLAILLAFPFRKGEKWSRWAIPLIGLGSAVPTLYATLFIRSRTSAAPPWFAATAAIVLLVAGFLISLGSGSQNKKEEQNV